MAKTLYFDCFNFEAWMESKTKNAIEDSRTLAKCRNFKAAKIYDEYATDLAQARVWMADDKLHYTVEAIKFGYRLSAYESKEAAFKGKEKVMEMDVICH